MKDRQSTKTGTTRRTKKAIGRRRRGQPPPPTRDALQRITVPLATALPLADSGDISPRTYTTLIKAAVSRTSIEDIANDDATGYCSKQVRKHLASLDFHEVEMAQNVLLHEQVGPWVQGRCMSVAIDITDIPTHEKLNPVIATVPDPMKPGKTMSLTKLRIGKPKGGTTKAYAMATIYVFDSKRRFTIGIRYVRGHERLVPVVEELLDILPELDITPKIVLLDREFYQGAIIEAIIARDMPFIIPAPKKGKPIKKLEQRNLGSRFVLWSLKGKGTERVEFELAVVARYKTHIFPRTGMKWFDYATYKVRGNPRHVMEVYRRRFGIESTYRMMNECRVKTCSKSLAYRLLIFLIAMMIINLKFIFELELSPDQREPRKKMCARIRLSRLKRIILIQVTVWLKRDRLKRKGVRRSVPNY